MADDLTAIIARLNQLISDKNTAIELYRASFATPEELGPFRFWTQDELDRIQSGFASADDVIKFLAEAILALLNKEDATEADLHDRLHLLYGPDHTDVDKTEGLQSRHVLAVKRESTIFHPEYRNNWRGEWIPQTYYRSDQVEDDGWLMIANKQTLDRAAPQPTGDPVYLYDGTLASQQVVASQAFIGARYTPQLRAQFITGYRIYTTAGESYRVFRIDDPLGTPVESEILNLVNAPNTGWQEYNVTGGFIGVGATVDVVVQVAEPDPAPAVVNASYNYQTPQNPRVPISGEIVQSRGQSVTMSIHKTDNDGTDRSVTLGLLTIGDHISGAGVLWTVQNTSELVTHYDIVVTPSLTGSPTGVQNFEFAVNAPQAIDYQRDFGFWAGDARVAGIFGADVEYGTIVPDDNQYIVDLQFQDYTTSDDWDYQAYSGALSGLSGGTDPGDCECIKLCLPPGYACSAYSDELVAQGMQWIMDANDDLGELAYPFGTVRDESFGSTNYFNAWSDFGVTPFFLDDWGSTSPELVSTSGWSWSARAAEYKQCQITTSLGAVTSLAGNSSGGFAVTPPAGGLTPTKIASSSFVFTGHNGSAVADIQLRFRPVALWDVYYVGGRNPVVEGFLSIDVTTDGNSDAIITVRVGSGGGADTLVLNGGNIQNWINVSYAETNGGAGLGATQFDAYTTIDITVTNQDGTETGGSVTGFTSIATGTEITSFDVRTYPNLASTPRFFYGSSTNEDITIANLSYSGNTLVDPDALRLAFKRTFSTYQQPTSAQVDDGDLIAWNEASDCWDPLAPFWTEEAPSDGDSYVRNNKTWIRGVEEAPIDNGVYSRSNGDWVSGGGGGRSLLRTVEIVAPVGSVTFDTIDQTYRRLWVVYVAKSDENTNLTSMLMEFNDDPSGATYHRQGWTVYDGGAGGSEGESATATFLAVSGANVANVVCSGEVRLDGYTRTDMYKVVDSKYTAGRADGSVELGNRSGHWKNLSAITKIVITPSAGLLTTGYFQLYGEN